MTSNKFLAGSAFLALFFSSLGCNMLQKIANVNLFEGDNAVKAAQKIKDKIGTEKVQVIRVNIEKNEMEITVQSAKNPKDIDKYIYKNGTVTGPEPVQVISMGNLSMTGDKYETTELGEIGFAAIPDTVAKAISLSKLENAQVSSISMDNNYPETADPSLKADREKQVEDLQKRINDRRQECTKNVSTLGDCLREVSEMQKELMDMRMGRTKRKLVLTWRLFIESPRGRKDFWADKNGKLNETSF